MDRDSLIARLNAETREERLDALSEIKRLTDMGELRTPEKTGYVNNHIHTIYSFSPYSPAMAVWRAWQSGLSTAGIMDHDSVSGALEFIESRTDYRDADDDRLRVPCRYVEDKGRGQEDQ